MRLADATIQLAGRAGETSSWLKKAVPDAGAVNGSSPPSLLFVRSTESTRRPVGDSESTASEKLKDERSSVLDSEKKVGAPTGDRVLVREVRHFRALFPGSLTDALLQPRPRFRTSSPSASCPT